MNDPPMPVPAELKGDEAALTIRWKDGVSHTLPWQLLRKLCPCASCRTARSEPQPQPGLLPIIKPEEAQPIRATSVRAVGNYAYGIAFSDGHNTGIYTLDFLRALGEQLAAADRME